MACHSGEISSTSNEIPILSYTMNCFSHIDDDPKLYRRSKTLASLHCRSCANIPFQHLISES